MLNISREKIQGTRMVAMFDKKKSCVLLWNCIFCDHTRHQCNSW